MDELEELADKGDGVNFIPCLKWVTKGVSKAQPEKVMNSQYFSLLFESYQYTADQTHQRRTRQGYFENKDQFR